MMTREERDIGDIGSLATASLQHGVRRAPEGGAGCGDGASTIDWRQKIDRLQSVRLMETVQMLLLAFQARSAWRPRRQAWWW